MRVHRSAVLSAALVVTAAAVWSPNPCTTAIPGVATAPPTLPPVTKWVPIGTTPKPPPIEMTNVCMKAEPGAEGDWWRPGSFKAWIMYKYLKANGPFIHTVSKDQMGGQTLRVQNAGTPIQAADFRCVLEGNEWKARVLDTAINKNILTIKLFDGWCDAFRKNESYAPLGGPLPLPVYCVYSELCLLQDISLYRSTGPKVGLRLDYGNCPVAPEPETRLPGTKNAIIMIGLKKVPDETATTPNIRGFFEEVCHKDTTAAPKHPDQTMLDLSKAQEGPTSGPCFADSADMEDISAVDQMTAAPCFNDAVVYTMLDSNNRFPALPVKDSDYAWLLSKLPAPDKSIDSPCHDLIQRQMVGQVRMDRVCVELEGLNGVTCQSTCGKICNATVPEGTTPPATTVEPPALCLDCESYELIYALIATCLVVALSYYTYLANSLSWVGMWFFVELDGSPHKTFEELKQQSHISHHKVNPKLTGPALLGLFLICGFWSIVIYLLINLIDTLICWALDYSQCIRLWPWQYSFDLAHYYSVNGTAFEHSQDLLTLDERGRWIWWWEGPRTMINIDWCPGRLLGMIMATWLPCWLLMCWWRYEMKVAVLKTTVSQEYIYEEQGLMGPMTTVGGQAHGAGGMLTKAIAFFGGGHVPPP